MPKRSMTKSLMKSFELVNAPCATMHKSCVCNDGLLLPAKVLDSKITLRSPRPMDIKAFTTQPVQTGKEKNGVWRSKSEAKKCTMSPSLELLLTGNTKQGGSIQNKRA